MKNSGVNKLNSFKKGKYMRWTFDATSLYLELYSFHFHIIMINLIKI
jgi:hypothetical protein